MKRWPFVLALALMGGAWALVASRSGAEATLVREPFAGFPLALEGWTGKDLKMDERVLDVLKLSDHVMRAYAPPVTGASAEGAFDGRQRQSAAPVYLYVGYYASQRTGATYHSPKNCLPGGGWQFKSTETLAGAVPGAPGAAINRVVIEKGFDRQMILYWYQGAPRLPGAGTACRAGSRGR